MLNRFVQSIDPKSKKDAPTWMMVDVAFKEKWQEPVTLAALKANPKLSDMKVVQKGQRLSVQPVTKDEYNAVLEMACRN